MLKLSKFDPHGPFGIMLPPSVGEAVRKMDTGRFKSPKYQRGNLNMLWAIFNDGDGAIVVMTNNTLSETSGSGTTYCGIRWNSDGSCDRRGPGSTAYSQTHVGEWWSAEPDTGIGAGYQVRALSAGKTGTWSTAAASDNAWISITSDRLWGVQFSSKFGGSKTCSATFEIGVLAAGSADDSAVISCTAIRT